MRFDILTNCILFMFIILLGNRLFVSSRYRNDSKYSTLTAFTVHSLVGYVINLRKNVLI